MNTTEMMIEELDKMSDDEIKGEIAKIQLELSLEFIERNRLREKRKNNIAALSVSYFILLLSALVCKLGGATLTDWCVTMATMIIVVFIFLCIVFWP